MCRSSCSQAGGNSWTWTARDGAPPSPRPVNPLDSNELRPDLIRPPIIEAHMADTKRPRPTRPKSNLAGHEHVRTGLSAKALWDAVRDHLFYLLGRHAKTATINDIYLAVAYAVRDRLFQRGADTLDALLIEPDAKVVAYLSAEFLMGPHLGANLL